MMLLKRGEGGGGGVGQITEEKESTLRGLIMYSSDLQQLCIGEFISITQVGFTLARRKVVVMKRLNI